MDKTPSRMELLVLCTIARRPMHGYEIKLELRYKHVRWWAKCEHSHLYAALARLEAGGMIAATEPEGARGKKVFALTDAGRARMEEMLFAFGSSEQGPYFDVDLFLSGAFTLDRARVLATLEERRAALEARLAEAEALRAAMAGRVPNAALLIMEHRAGTLRNEIAFTTRAAETLAAQEEWRPFLGDESISSFVAREDVPLE